MKTLSRVIPALAVTFGLLALVSTSAQADDWNNHQRHAQDWHRHHFHPHPHGPVYVQEPNVVYAPPVVVEAPPVEEAPGLSLTIPLNFH